MSNRPDGGMQGISSAPRGVPLRNTFIQAIWETTPINGAVSRDYPPPHNTGSHSVALPVYRDVTLGRLTGARARSIAALGQDWEESGRAWGGMDASAVASKRATLTPLRAEGVHSSTQGWRSNVRRACRSV
jgi:hypothetical protein|eukprot:COSAG01_NODE_2849_length_6977_cov_66.208200_5_plen_131_part_00